MTELNLDDLADRQTACNKYRVVHPGNELAWGGATLESVDHPCPSSLIGFSIGKGLSIIHKIQNQWYWPHYHKKIIVSPYLYASCK